jgi:hypothetical protein
MFKHALVFVIFFIFAAAAGAQTLFAVMTGANEAPAVGDPDGFGLGGFRIEGTSIAFTLMVKNVTSPSAAHIHRGAVGTSGPPVISFASVFSTNIATGTVTASVSLIEEIRHEPWNFYADVHNSEFPNGAIRGQLGFGAFAVTTGAQVVPGPGDPDGFGMAVFRCCSRIPAHFGIFMSYHALVQNISPPNASHVHRGAPGASGPVVIPMANSYSDDTAAAAVDITGVLDAFTTNATDLYFDVHNSEFGEGAIRGQLQSAPYTETYYFPVVGHAEGVNNTRFVSDVRAVNTSPYAQILTLEYFPGSPAGLSTASATKGLWMAPGAEAVLNDVVASQFSTMGLGALKIGASSPMSTGVRVFNDLRPIGQGTTGFSIRPKAISEAKTTGTLLFLSEASASDITSGAGFRTNIGWFNPNLESGGATFEAHRASDGSLLGSVVVGIAGLSQLQQAVFSLISGVTAAEQVQTDFYVTWTSTLPIFVYGAVVDNRTGDVVYVD